jgi:hypothetical protein
MSHRSTTLRFETLESRALLSSSRPLAGAPPRERVPEAPAQEDKAAKKDKEPAPDLGPAVAPDHHSKPGHHSERVDAHAPYFNVAGERVWNFAQTPDHVSIADGDWFDPFVWSSSRVPAAGETVHVSTHLTYSRQNDAAIRAINIKHGGSLAFRADVDTRLVVGTLIILPGGALEVGTPERPIDAAVTAEIIFADLPLDLTNDPEQHGIGLIALDADVTVHGAVLNRSFSRLSEEARAGSTSIEFESPVQGWRVGDELVLPDTRSYAAHRGISPQWEKVNIAGIGADGRTITLATPLAFDHLGARDPDGRIVFLGHVGNLRRNVVFRSENPQGTRGHTLFAGHGDVDIQYAAFESLGRTRADVHLDSTVLDPLHKVEHVGTNQVARYSVHFHHLIGPEADHTPAHGYQFRFRGNAVQDSPKWGVAVHGAHYGLVEQNVIYDADGAGIALEDGSESFNRIVENFIVATTGSGEDPGNRGKGDIPKMVQQPDGKWVASGDPGHEGSGIWARGSNNYFIGNVTADSGFAGLLVYSFHSQHYRPHVPRRQGDDPDVRGQYDVVYTDSMVPLAFEGNESYGSRVAEFEFWQIGGVKNRDYAIRDNSAWHAATAVNTLYSARMVIDGMTIVGDDTGIAFGGHPLELVANNWNVQGMQRGLDFSTAHNLEITDSYFRNHERNINLYPSRNFHPTRSIIRDVSFEPIDGSPSVEIWRDWSPHEYTDHLVADQTFVYNHDGVPGDDFQLMYPEQAADYVVPTTGMGNETINPLPFEGRYVPWARLSPIADATNEELWHDYGLAVAGGIARENYGMRPLLNGLVTPIPDDLTVPEIEFQSVRVTDITTTSAVVRWRTNEASTSRVEYAARSNYYDTFTTLQQAQLVFEHAVTLTGLTPGEFHRVSVHSIDTAGNGAALAHWSFDFKTLSKPQFPTLGELAAIANGPKQGDARRGEVLSRVVKAPKPASAAGVFAQSEADREAIEPEAMQGRLATGVEKTRLHAERTRRAAGNVADDAAKFGIAAGNTVRAASRVVGGGRNGASGPSESKKSD